jgi:hypothetical protein
MYLYYGIIYFTVRQQLADVIHVLPLLTYSRQPSRGNRSLESSLHRSRWTRIPPLRIGFIHSIAWSSICVWVFLARAISASTRLRTSIILVKDRRRFLTQIRSVNDTTLFCLTAFCFRDTACSLWITDANMSKTFLGLFLKQRVNLFRISARASLAHLPLPPYGNLIF